MCQLSNPELKILKHFLFDDDIPPLVTLDDSIPSFLNENVIQEHIDSTAYNLGSQEPSISQNSCASFSDDSTKPSSFDFKRNPEKVEEQHLTWSTQPTSTMRLCKVQNCTRAIQKNGRCHSHGGKRLCKVEGCVRKDRGNGKCVQHGGGKRCSVQDCSKLVRRGNMCVFHTKERK